MLDIDPNREEIAPRDAATLVVIRNRVRDAATGADERRIEVFCVERNKSSRFLGGAIVFPGGKLDDSDRDPRWKARTTAPPKTITPIADDEDAERALYVTACREALEEAALLPVAGGTLTDGELIELRSRMIADPGSLLSFLEERALLLDLAMLQPIARWVTPIVESRRFDTRFFLVAAPRGQSGAHDDHETMASFWATPREILDRFRAGSVLLAPPTHRTLEILALHESIEDAFAATRALSLDVICPRLVRGTDGDGAETMALVLPGDPEHEVVESRTPGASRFVLNDGRWLPGDARPPDGEAQRPSR